jgi:pSer/pThr/pTyr-binding forkhead associated (FHA) protein
VDGGLITLWIIRLSFLALLYLFLALVARALLRDLRATVRSRSTEPGRLVVVASAGDDLPRGAILVLETITTIGRDVNNGIIVDDPFVSAAHAALTFRGRGWYVEDLGSTNGTYVDGVRVDGVALVPYGHEVQVGQARLRLERGRG